MKRKNDDLIIDCAERAIELFAQEQKKVINASLTHKVDSQKVQDVYNFYQLYLMKLLDSFYPVIGAASKSEKDAEINFKNAISCTIDLVIKMNKDER